MQLALTSEINNKRAIDQENEQLRRQLLDQERELRDFKHARELLEGDLQHSIQKSNADFHALRDANHKLVQEAEHLKNETDRLRHEGRLEAQAGDELRKELGAVQEARHRQELKIQDLQLEVEGYRALASDSKAHDV